MKLKIKFKMPGYADCDIEVKAKGFILASIYWANINGVLPEWSSVAVFPIEPSGNGHYSFRGHRAIPDGATHVCVRCISQDFFSIEDALTEIPEEFLPLKIASDLGDLFILMSDLHLSDKPGKVVRALQMTDSTILISGDLTNDGLVNQFEKFQQCIENETSNRLVLAVTGNHDQLSEVNYRAGRNVYSGYDIFQKYLFDRAQKQGIKINEDQSGAYSVQYGMIDIVGLQCVSSSRKFGFADGAQLRWLNQHLNDRKEDQWHIIMCHAPLLEHNPHRNEGSAYFGGNNELQKIINDHRNIIFVSGHTHFSPNTRQGNVEYCKETQTVYVDDGSVTPTELRGELPMPAEWKDGVISELKLYRNYVEITFKSIHNCIRYPRGYYRFEKK